MEIHFRPCVFALAAAVKMPLQLPYSVISVTVPRGGRFRLDYILADFPRTIVAGAQTSPELRFRLFDSRGVAVNDPQIPFHGVTTPAGVRTVKAAWAWRIEYDPGEIITMEVMGQVAGPVPATVSVTYLGQRSWVKR